MESDIWKKPPLYFKLWHYLLLKAQHSDYKNLKRGQLWTSIPEIREAMSYYSGYRKVTPTEKEVRCAIDWLRNPYGGKNGEETEGSMIVTTRGVHGILVTICNYNKYQGYEFYEGRDEGRDGKSTEVTRRSEQGRYINKNDKNDKNDKNVNNNTYTPAVQAIVDYLNELTASNYRATTKKTRDLIVVRLKEGFTVDDFKTVIYKKTKEWKGSDMEKFLRPETLFGTKFEGYLNQKEVSKGNTFLNNWEDI